ncbi:MAG: KOW domain-containing RNA-binding protein [Lachnospiraceae bacterium]|nr:KOW domain-containing RNA-binding protein [Lachnospiraceae bacterium]
MDKDLCGMLAFSRAGHDRDRVYLIVDQDEEYVYLCDGRLRTVDKPKKKKYKHIQIVKRVSDEVRECMESGNRPDDIMIRRTIEEFKKRQD